MDGMEFLDFLREAITEKAEDEDIDIDVVSFSRAGLLTNNIGIVVYVDGKSFQVQINGEYSYEAYE